MKSSPVVVGWSEWVSLVDYGPMILKAKIDTGARTSALHTFSIEEVPGPTKRIRFGVHPRQRTIKKEVYCEADVIEKRIVRDSGGHEEERYVVRVKVCIGDVRRKIDVTLTDRENMQFRMLIGRSALRGFIVDPTRRNLLGQKREMLKRYNEEHSR